MDSRPVSHVPAVPASDGVLGQTGSSARVVGVDSSTSSSVWSPTPAPPAAPTAPPTTAPGGPAIDATDHGARGATGQRAAAGTALVVALGGLTGDGTGDGADATTDDGPDRAADGHADRGTSERAGTGTHGLATMLLVLDGRAVTFDGDVVDRRVVDVVRHERIVVRGQRVVIVVHWVSLLGIVGRAARWETHRGVLPRTVGAGSVRANGCRSAPPLQRRDRPRRSRSAGDHAAGECDTAPRRGSSGRQRATASPRTIVFHPARRSRAMTDGRSRTLGRLDRLREPGGLERALTFRIGPLGSLLVGIGVAWAAIFLKAMLNELIDGETGYILLMAAIVVAAWFGGLIGGLTATVVALLLNIVVFVAPLPASGADRAIVFRQLLYLVVGGGVAVLVASRRSAGDRLADALDDVAAMATELEARDARLELMLAASGTGFWEWDIDSNELTWSDAIFRQHGLEPQPRAPDFPTYLEMIHPDDRAAFQRAVGDAVERQDSFSLEFRLLWPDGTVHWTQGAGRVFPDDDGRPARMLGTGQDITEQRRLEGERDALVAAERRAGEFREAFVDVISHELRTPITTILGLTQILARPGRVDDVASRTALLQDVRAESERLHRLVEDLLVLSRMERGVLVADAEPLEPRRMLERIVAHEAVELPTLRIDVVVEPGLPIVAGEDTYVEQIVRNILGNAAKYTPVGTHVLVDARREDNTVAIRFLDDGPGIPEGSADQLFELFYRDPVSARTVSGSGIGLFVCASLAEAMGGRMWARRRPEGGSEFGFTMRVLEADEEFDAPARAGTAARAASAGP